MKYQKGEKGTGVTELSDRAKTYLDRNLNNGTSGGCERPLVRKRFISGISINDPSNVF